VCFVPLVITVFSMPQQRAQRIVLHVWLDHMRLKVPQSAYCANLEEHPLIMLVYVLPVNMVLTVSRMTRQQLVVQLVQQEHFPMKVHHGVVLVMLDVLLTPVC